MKLFKVFEYVLMLSSGIAFGILATVEVLNAQFCTGILLYVFAASVFAVAFCVMAGLVYLMLYLMFDLEI